MGLIKPKACKRCKKEYSKAKKKYEEHRTFLKKLLGYCPCCERYFRYSVKTKRRNTAYCEEASNWLTACSNCHRDDYEYFADLWNQYYDSI